MKLIDTHSHLYDEAFDTDRDEAMARAREAGLVQLLFPAIDRESHPRMLEVVARYGDYCRPMMGLHPTSINENPLWREELEEVVHYFGNPPRGVKFCAVGEIGIDLYWSQEYREEQIEAFEYQCRLALRLNLPVVIHTRSAWPEMVEAVERLDREAQAEGRSLRGVFHAFTEGVECYERLKHLEGFYFGIGGVVTFKKSPVAEAVKQIPLERILLETDCPYLTPVPHRGERNESSYLLHICRKVAELKGVDAEEVARITTENACRLFALAE